MLERYLLIAVAGSLGAISRYALGGYINSVTGSAFPLGTFVINITGSVILGFAAAAGLDRFVTNPVLRTAFTVGFIGAYTTFSTWSFETLRLIEDGSYLLALANAAGSLVAGLVAVWLGIVVARLI